MADHSGEPPPFEIFRAEHAADFESSGMMHPAGSFPGSIVEASQGLIEAGMLEGSKLRVLFRRRGGFSLSYAWFKSGYPLPLHSHSTPCLYFILAGSLRIGTQELGPGDGFYLDPDVPYIYEPGPQGVEVLEFRDTDSFDIKLLSRNVKWWEKARDRLKRIYPGWQNETRPPSGIVTP